MWWNWQFSNKLKIGVTPFPSIGLGMQTTPQGRFQSLQSYSHHCYQSLLWTSLNTPSVLCEEGLLSIQLHNYQPEYTFSPLWRRITLHSATQLPGCYIVGTIISKSDAYSNSEGGPLFDSLETTENSSDLYRPVLQTNLHFKSPSHPSLDNDLFSLPSDSQPYFYCLLTDSN